MVKQYPYTLQVLSITGETQDADGNWVPGTPLWSFYCYCRDEAGNGKLIQTADGSEHTYTVLIQMPIGTEAIAPGTKVRILDGEQVRADGNVVYSRKDQLHSRSWV